MLFVAIGFSSHHIGAGKNVLRAFSHAKAWPAEFGAIPQLRCLALSRTSIRRGCHESVMHLVMSSAEWLLSVRLSIL